MTEETETLELDEIDRFENDGTDITIDQAVVAEQTRIEDLPWERQPGEPDSHYRMFLQFRDSRTWRELKARTIRGTIRGAGGGQATVDLAYEVARRWKWRERAQAWDDTQRREWEQTRRNEILSVVELEAKLAAQAGVTASFAFTAARKSWEAHGPAAALIMTPQDAARAMAAASDTVTKVMRPVIPDEIRGADLKVSGSSPVVHTEVRVDADAARAFIDAAARIADASRPVIPGVLAATDELDNLGAAEGGDAS